MGEKSNAKMKLFKYLALGALLVDPTEGTARRGKRRRQLHRPQMRSLDPMVSFDRFELPQGDDPYADRGLQRGSRPDYDGIDHGLGSSSSSSSSYSSNSNRPSSSSRPSSSYNNNNMQARNDNANYDEEVCIEEPEPECPQAPECIAEMKKEDKCICDCNEEPPPKCDLDIVLLIDVCSCSIDVWNGVKSYADALVS